MSLEKDENEFPYIPDEAFLYFPKGTYYSNGSDDDPDYISGTGKNTKRNIFEGGVRYTQYENEQLQRLEDRIEENKLKFPPFWDRALKLRFLQST